MTYEEALERFRSDKPDVRFGMELVDLGPALGGADGARRPASACSMPRSPRAGGSGHRGARDGGGSPGANQRADRTGAPVRDGAWPICRSSQAGRSAGPIAKFLSDDIKRAIIERSGAGEGDLILIVADTPRRSPADVLGRLRVELGDRWAWPIRTCSRTLGQPLPDVPVGH